MHHNKTTLRRGGWLKLRIVSPSAGITRVRFCGSRAWRPPLSPDYGLPVVLGRIVEKRRRIVNGTRMEELEGAACEVIRMHGLT